MSDADDNPAPATKRRDVPWHAIGVAFAAVILLGIIIVAAPQIYSYVTGRSGDDTGTTAHPSTADLRDRGAESLALLYSVDVPEDQLREMPTRVYAHNVVDLIVDGERTHCLVTLVDTSPIRDVASCNGENLPYK